MIDTGYTQPATGTAEANTNLTLATLQAAIQNITCKMPPVWYATSKYIDAGTILKIPATDFGPEYLVIHDGVFEMVKAQYSGTVWKHIRDYRQPIRIDFRRPI